MELLKNKNGFSFVSHDVSFSFNCDILPEKKGDLFEKEIKGNVPVPIIKKGDRLMLPVDEGIAIAVEKEYASDGFDLNCISGRFLSNAGTVSMVIVERNSRFLLIALKSGLGAVYKAERVNGMYTLEIVCDRHCLITYGIFDSIVDACKCYRNLRAGKPLSLEEKIRNNPDIKKLVGGGIFWVWNNNYDAVMYADKDTDENPGIGEKLLDIADELYEGGVKKALFGLFFETDSHLSEDLWKKNGYLSTQYDNYNDVLNPELLSVIPGNRVKNCDYTARRMKDYPEGVQILQNGTMRPAWSLKGFDGEMHPQNTLCPKVAAKRMKEEIPEIMKRFPYYKGRFIDVYGGISVSACYSEEHPVTLDQCVEIKKDAFKFLGDIGLIAGTEDGMEEFVEQLVYTEGLHSPVCFRIKDAGRKHAHTYNEGQKEHINKHMYKPENRVPLWQLVYHENMLVFPYWGDSTEMFPEYINKKILFACLYGCAPLYSFSEKDFAENKENILMSYKRITEIHEKTALLPMSDFVNLTDDYQVQKSVFGDKYEIVANFSGAKYVYKNVTIMPDDLYFGEI